jgi:hypothetical protein
MKTHFDKQIDKIRAMISDKIADMKFNPNLFEENKQNGICQRSSQSLCSYRRSKNSKIVCEKFEE